MYLFFFCLHTACKQPPVINDGKYDEDLSDKYKEGQKVSFSCYDRTLTQPSDGRIVCGDSGWVENAICSRSWFISCTNTFDCEY